MTWNQMLQFYMAAAAIMLGVFIWLATISPADISGVFGGYAGAAAVLLLWMTVERLLPSPVPGPPESEEK